MVNLPNTAVLHTAFPTFYRPLLPSAGPLSLGAPHPPKCSLATLKPHFSPHADSAPAPNPDPPSLAALALLSSALARANCVTHLALRHISL